MRCLVTGGTGFIGSNIVKRLLSDGHTVIATGTTGEQPLPAAVQLLPSFIGIDWSKLGKIDAIFHEAALVNTMVMDRNEMFKVNVDGTKELFTKAIANGCKHIVYATSTAIYGDAPAPYKEDTPKNPLNPYAESKLIMEHFAQHLASKHPDVVIVGLRYCNVYGPGESHKGKMATQIYQIAQQMLKGNPRVFKHGEQKRDWAYVKDVVSANLLAAHAKQSCIVNCGSGTATSFNDIIAILNETLKLQRTTEYIDNPYAAQYQSHTECDMTLAKEKIGFVPQYDIRTGIKDYYDSGFLVPK
jgi:ADP-L-glycero-D-manno-heptose 6-epimerase